MKSPLNIVYLEDDPNDVALVQAALNADGIACTTTCVKDRDGFISALERGGIDLVLSDFSLPTFDGFSAAEMVQTKWPGIPIILVSGARGEELAVDSIKSGATDYVLKDRLVRLGPAVRRAMREVDERVERQRLAAQFIEAQKMEAIGHLTGGVAHDFNNVLAVIMGYSSMLVSELPPDSPLRRYAVEIQLASERAVGLTRQLLIVSRKHAVNPVVLVINDVVNDLTSLLRRLVDEQVDLTITTKPDAGCVKADAGYIGQILMNLVVNARDAMPDGGTISIETGNASIDDDNPIVSKGAVPGDYVTITVGDTGTGMTEEVLSHLFEAFFTTKPAGKGTGLGLTTCQTIVQQSGGFIDVHSQLGEGTTFRVYLPQVGQAGSVAAVPAHAEAAPRGQETVLVVEDEPSVRRLAYEVLTSHGYEVLTAKNGRDALRVAGDHRGSQMCLVVADVVMPGMDGHVMAGLLRAANPSLKLLFTSGYTELTIAYEDLDEAGAAFLRKPYTAVALARKVRELLDGEYQPMSAEQGVPGPVAP